ncbi:MAG: response regulator [Chloroflexota bacterium]
MKVLLVDDHPVFRRGLREILEGDGRIEIVAEAGSGEQALEQTHLFHPDVILMDLHMPVQDGIATTRQIKAELPATEVVILSAFEDDEEVLLAFEAGASGYLTKGDDVYSMRRAICNASAGTLHMGPSIAKRVLERMARRPSAETSRRRQAKNELTPRETTVLQLIAQGKKSREIAVALGVSQRTVSQHKANIFSRLQIHNRADAILYAIRKGMVQV